MFTIAAIGLAASSTLLIFQDTTWRTLCVTTTSTESMNVLCCALRTSMLKESARMSLRNFDYRFSTNSYIFVIFPSCDHQTASDFVEFSNFMSTDRKFSRYCGKLADFEVRSDGRFFRVTFYSNDRFVANGFRALYTFESIVEKSSNVNIELGDNSVSMQSFVSSGSQLITGIMHIFVIIALISKI